MIRLFFDTNVIASAYATPGTCRRLFRVCLERHTIFISPYILKELEKTLINKFCVPKEDVARIINSLHFSCKIVAHEGVPEKVSRDPKDDPLLADSAQAGVDYIVTGDKNLLVLACYKNIPIVAPGLLPKIDSAFEE